MLKRSLRFEATLCVWLGVLACIAGGSIAVAEEPPAGETPAEAAEPAGPADAYDRGVPRSAMLGFLVAVEHVADIAVVLVVELFELIGNRAPGSLL